MRPPDCDRPIATARQFKTRRHRNQLVRQTTTRSTSRTVLSFIWYKGCLFLDKFATVQGLVVLVLMLRSPKPKRPTYCFSFCNGTKRGCTEGACILRRIRLPVIGNNEVLWRASPKEPSFRANEYRYPQLLPTATLSSTASRTKHLTNVVECFIVNVKRIATKAATPLFLPIPNSILLRNRTRIFTSDRLNPVANRQWIRQSRLANLPNAFHRSP